MTATTRPAQPTGLFILFLTEMWERFSYYGMRAILVLYLTSEAAKGGLGWSAEEASQLYGWYTGLVFLTPILGGYLADRFIGTHRSMIIGGLIISAGHFCLAFPTMPTFYLGLLFIIVGTGFFKPNVSTMVGQLYSQDDPRRDSGFTVFYMGINLGALLGTFICGYLGESADWGWHYGFGAAGIGMILGLIAYAWLRPKYLGGIGERRIVSVVKSSSQGSGAVLTSEERQRIGAILIVSFFVIFFWVAFEQAGSSMNLFAKNSTERMLLGFEIPASWFQSINPAVILLGGPLFAWLWAFLGRKGIEPSTPAKMATGLICLGAGFVAMVFGALEAKSGLANPLWLLVAYVLNSIGELCLSPVGLSLVTKLAPVRLASLLMGTFFLANFVANLLGGYLAGAIEKVARGEYFVLLGGTADFYAMFVASSVGAGVLFLMLTPFLKRLMGEHA